LNDITKDDGDREGDLMNLFQKDPSGSSQEKSTISGTAEKKRSPSSKTKEGNRLNGYSWLEGAVLTKPELFESDAADAVADIASATIAMPIARESASNFFMSSLSCWFAGQCPLFFREAILKIKQGIMYLLMRDLSSKIIRFKRESSMPR
jgi:hypothetical protein